MSVISKNTNFWGYRRENGRVVAPIKAGEHAHVHNIKTKRW